MTDDNQIEKQDAMPDTLYYRPNITRKGKLLTYGRDVDPRATSRSPADLGLCLDAPVRVGEYKLVRTYLVHHVPSKFSAYPEHTATPE